MAADRRTQHNARDCERHPARSPRTRRLQGLSQDHTGKVVAEHCFIPRVMRFEDLVAFLAAQLKCLAIVTLACAGRWIAMDDSYRVEYYFGIAAFAFLSHIGSPVQHEAGSNEQSTSLRQHGAGLVKFGALNPYAALIHISEFGDQFLQRLHQLLVQRLEAVTFGDNSNNSRIWELMHGLSSVLKPDGVSVTHARQKAFDTFARRAPQRTFGGILHMVRRHFANVPTAGEWASLW